MRARTTARFAASFLCTAKRRCAGIIRFRAAVDTTPFLESRQKFAHGGVDHVQIFAGFREKQCSHVSGCCGLTSYVLVQRISRECQPLSDAADLLASDSVEAFALAYGSLLQATPHVTPTLLERLVANRQDMSRADVKEVRPGLQLAVCACTRGLVSLLSLCVCVCVSARERVARRILVICSNSVNSTARRKCPRNYIGVCRSWRPAEKSTPSGRKPCRLRHRRR